VTRDIEFHHLLTPTYLKFENDESGMEYITLNHETLKKNTKVVLMRSLKKHQTKECMQLAQTLAQ
jgi:hypothetical protein